MLEGSEPFVSGRAEGPADDRGPSGAQANLQLLC